MSMRSRIIRFEELFIVAVVLFTQANCQCKFCLVDIGTSFNFTCPGSLTKNYTFTFTSTHSINSPAAIAQRKARTKQFGNVLMIANVKLEDSGQYYCDVYDQDGNKKKTHILMGILIARPVIVYEFKMFPEIQTSFIDEGASFQFRCEYQKKSTQLMWERRRSGDNKNASAKVDYIPREYITDVKDTSKSVEVYSIAKVKTNDSGTYRCQVMENGKLKSTRVHVLQVKGSEAPHFKELRSVFVVNANKDKKITFEITGAPKANISCYHNDRLVIFCSAKAIDTVDVLIEDPPPACTNENYEFTVFHDLIIKAATFSRNNGLYRCDATNIIGTDTVHFRVNVSAPATISEEDRNIFLARENLDGFVKCLVIMTNPRPTVTWSEQDLPTVQATPKDDQWTTSPFKSTLVHIREGSYESTLSILWSKKQTFFRCFANNSLGNDSRVFKFLRYGKGEEPFVVTPSSVVVNEQQTFTAKCRVAIVVSGEVAFYKEDTKTFVANDNRTNLNVTRDKDFRNITMVISNLTVNDSGTYTCKGKNVETNHIAAVTLTVKALRPPMILDLQNQSAEYQNDTQVVLFCNVTGNPKPYVTWLDSDGEIGKKLVVDSCDRIESGYVYLNERHTKLAVCQPRIRYTGFYTCVAENKLGRENRTAHLNVLSKPIFQLPKSRKSKVLLAGDRLTLPCKVDGNPTPAVQWIFNGNTAVTKESKGTSKLVIREMNESYIGNYTCVAKNSRGIVKKQFLELDLNIPDDTVRDETSAGGGMAAGNIVGIVIAISVVLVLVFLVIFFWYRRQQKKLLFYKHQYFLRTGEYSVDPNLTLNEQSMNLPYDNDWEFPFERLVVGERLGAGAFGEVYKAEAMGILSLNPRDKSSIASKRRSKIRRSLRASQRPKKKSIPPDLSNAVVAVKTVKGQATENEIRDLAAELKLMIHIGEHKNIVNLLGACTKGRKLYVILEFCPHGNLLTFLRSKRDIYNSTWTKEIYNPEKEFTLIDIVGAAFQIAKGMEFLASRKLIHRDLAARNILVADGYVMKISDFGLARDIYKNDVYVKTSSGMLPVKWMAVESLFDRVYTHQSDVWSFGVLLWEMMTLGGTPYPDLPAEQLLDFLNEGKRMQQPVKCPLEVYTIMRDCWQEQPEQRPTFSSLVEHLGRILERHLEEANPYLNVEASPEEIEAAKEKDELLNAKSDYYLQPLLMSNKLHGYNSSAPLPTPPTDAYTEATAPLPDVDTKAAAMKAAGSYERLRDGTPEQKRKEPSDNKDAVGLEVVNGRQQGNVDEFQQSKHIESVV